MRIGISTSVIQRGKTGVAQYVFALLRALKAFSCEHEFTLFVLEEDLPLFAFISGRMRMVTVAERFRPPIKNILWHQKTLPRLARELSLDVLHIPSYRRMLWGSSCPRVATIHDLAPFHVARKYDWKRMFYGRVVVRRLARRQDGIIAISENTARENTTFFLPPREGFTSLLSGRGHKRFFPAPPDKPRKQ